MSRGILSWGAYTAIVSLGLMLLYGAEWRELAHLSPATAWGLRLTALIGILAVSCIASALSELVPLKVQFLRGLVVGLFTGLGLRQLAGWVGDHYLGSGGAVDFFRLGSLMFEGYGMTMYEIGAPLIGILAWIRSSVSAPRDIQT